MERQFPTRSMTPWISVVRMAPDRLRLSPEWEARALELRQDWSRVTSQLEALARALRAGGVAGQGMDGAEVGHEGRASETSRWGSE